MTDTPDRPTLCIGVLTLNEEKRIAQCLRSAAFADQIVVVDSGSTDRTCDIARELGAEVHVYGQWEGFAVQRNRLLAHCHSDFIFFLDADEEITPGLQQEIEQATASNEQTVGETYWLEVAFGKPLHHLRNRKTLPRFFKRDALAGFEGVVHEGANLTAPNIRHFAFKNPLLHYSRETIHGSLKKLTQYAMLGAAKRAAKGKSGGVVRGLASGMVMFIRLYFFRLAILSGGPGFLYSFFIALECFFRYAALHYDQDSLSSTLKR